MKLALTLLLAAATLPAQIDSVSATAAGDQIFFTTWLRPAGTDYSTWRKAYVIQDSAVSLFAQEDGEHWRVDGVSVSSDGSVAGVNRSNPCNHGTSCVGVLQEFSEIRSPAGSARFDGHAEISPAGRFAVLKRTTGFGVFPAPDVRARALQRVDLSSPDSEPEPLGYFPAQRGRWIADGGTALAIPVQGSGWTLSPVEGEPIRIGYPTLAPRAAFLLPDASAVVYQTEASDGAQDDASGELRIRYLDGTEASIGVSGELMDLSADGRVALYLAPEIEGARQAFTLDLPGGAARQATFIEGGVEAAALAPDGPAVFAVSQGRLLRVDLADGHTTTLVGPLPDVDRGNLSGFEGFKSYRERHVPGSTYRIGGARLAATTTLAPQPAGFELDGVQVLVHDTPAAVLWTSPFEIGYQVDWATEVSEESTVVVRYAAFGWEAPLAVHLEEVWPRSALPAVDGLQWAVHQEFDRLVTPADPALPGEYIHLYATGMGPTDPAVETGLASPSVPPAMVTTPCAWTDFDERIERSAEVVFAGLAPGLTGFYQIVWHIPEDVQGDYIALRCDPYGGFGRYPVQGRP